MKRRPAIVGIAASAAGWAVRAQTPGRKYRIGYLGYTATVTPEEAPAWNSFAQRLRELGFADGRNLVIEERYAEGRNERYADFAAELVRLDADLAVVTSGAAARAVMAASGSMPIVTVAVPDPVRAGLVASLARPGGQVTGLSNLSDDLVPKRIELLKAAVPAASRIAIARCPRCAQDAGQSATAVAARFDADAASARALGLTLLPIDVNAASDFDAAQTTLRRERPDALLIGATPINVPLRGAWLALADEQRLPMLAPYRGFGALLSYGPEYTAIFRRAAEYVARILNGARPADLPMEEPTKFEFVVNLKLARKIGLDIPRALLLRADEVIE